MRRQLSLLDCFGIGINGIIGSGIFLLPAVMVRCAGSNAPFAWLIVGGLCCLVALCFAEAASRTERSGGPYRYACDAFGPYVGFAVGWVTLISSVLGYTAVARGFGQNLAALMGRSGDPIFEILPGALVVLSLMGINLIGVRPGARTGDVLSVVKLGSLLGFAAVGLYFVNWSTPAPEIAPRPNLSDGERAGLLGAAFAGLFATTGFEYVPVPAGEAHNPRRTIPLAMVVSVIGATFLYMLIQFVALRTNPALGSSRAALVDTASVFGGGVGKLLLGVAALLSSFGFCTGSALVGPRYLESFAHDRFLPDALAYRSPTRGTPVYAVVALSALVLIMLCLPLRFENFANISNVAVVMQYMATSIAVLVMRRRPAPEGAFQVPLGPLVPLLALAGSCSFLLYVKQVELLYAGSFIAVGLLLGGAYRYRRLQVAGPAVS